MLPQPTREMREAPVGGLEWIGTGFGTPRAPLYGGLDTALSGGNLEEVKKAAIDNTMRLERNRLTPTDVYMRHGAEPIIDQPMSAIEDLPYVGRIFKQNLNPFAGEDRSATEGAGGRYLEMIGAAPRNPQRANPDVVTLGGINRAAANTAISVGLELGADPANLFLGLLGKGVVAGAKLLGRGAKATAKATPAGAKAFDATAKALSTEARYGPEIKAALREKRGLTDFDIREFNKAIKEIGEKHPLSKEDWSEVGRQHEQAMSTQPPPESVIGPPEVPAHIKAAATELGERISDPMHAGLKEQGIPVRALRPGERHMPHALESEWASPDELVEQARDLPRRSVAGEIKGAKSLKERKYDMTVEEAFEQGITFEKDPLKTWAKRGPEAIRAKHSARFIHEMAARPGAEAVKIKQVKDVPTGHALLDQRFVDEAGEVYRYAMKPDTAEFRVIKDQLAGPTSPKNGVWKALIWFGRFQKAHMLGTFGFGNRNMYNNPALMWYGMGNRSVKLDKNLRARKVTKGFFGLADYDNLKIGGRNYTKKELDRLMAGEETLHTPDTSGQWTPEMGKLGERPLGQSLAEGLTGKVKSEKVKEFILKAPGRAQAVNPASTRNVYIKATKSYANTIENHSRVMLFLDGLEQGMTPRQAGDFMRKYAFDYQDFTPGVAAARDYGVPFLGWLKNNTALQVEMLIKKGLIFNAPYRIAQGFEGQIPYEEKQREKGKLPHYQIKRGDRLIPWTKNKEGRYRTVKMELPQQDMGLIIDMLSGGGERGSEVASEIGSRIYPHIKVPLELGFNKDLFRDRPIDFGKDEKAPGYLDFLAQKLGLGNIMPGVYKNKKGETVVNPATKHAVEGMVPELGILSRATRDNEGAAWSQALSTILGVKQYPQPTKKDEARVRRQKRFIKQDKKKQEKRERQRLPF